MQKRGQVAVFVVVGIVIVILVALLFLGRNQYGIGLATPQFLNQKLIPIQKNAESCINTATKTVIQDFAYQGGDFEPLKYVTYQNKKVKYLCYNIEENNKCINMLPPFESMIQQLQERVDTDIKNCINPDLAKSTIGAYDSKLGVPQTKIESAGTSVTITVDYPVELSKDGTTVKLDSIMKELDAPLYDLYKTPYDIVESQASTGFFDQLIYMLSKKGKVIINVDKSPSTGNVGDIIYKINQKDDEFQFWFAIEGDWFFYKIGNIFVFLLSMIKNYK